MKLFLKLKIVEQLNTLFIIYIVRNSDCFSV